jgi:uncharacterized membrane protein YcaP (DUF421 family)
MFFDSWSGLGRVGLIGVLAYVVLVAFIRVSGKRTLTKLNAFDLVVTVALGSTLATVLLSKDIPLAEGVLALATLILLQYAITCASVRSSWFKSLVKSTPTILVCRGALIDDALLAQRVTRDEVHAVLRSQGVSAVEDVGALVLETDGTFSVMRSVDWNRAEVLSDIGGAERSNRVVANRGCGQERGERDSAVASHDERDSVVPSHHDGARESAH